MRKLSRKQIYLDDEQFCRLKTEADNKKKTVSEVIREAIHEYMEKSVKEVDWDNDPLTKAIGSITLDVDDASVNHDYYLYGGKKKE